MAWAHLQFLLGRVDVLVEGLEHVEGLLSHELMSQVVSIGCLGQCAKSTLASSFELTSEGVSLHHQPSMCIRGKLQRRSYRSFDCKHKQ